MQHCVEIRRDSQAKAYRVVVLFRLPMEEMFETATHVALFDAEVDAQKLVAAINAKLRATPYQKRLNGIVDILDRRYWQGPTSKAAAVQWDAEVAPFRVPAKSRAA